MSAADLDVATPATLRRIVGRALGAAVREPTGYPIPKQATIA